MLFSENLPEKILSRIPLLKTYLSPLISSTTRKRLANGAFWGGIAAFGSRFCLLITSFALARIIGQSGFGEYGMVISTASMINSFGGLGLGLTITKYISELKIKNPERSRKNRRSFHLNYFKQFDNLCYRFCAAFALDCF